MKEDVQPIVWITGASSGIGKSLVKKFALNKIYVAASARRGDMINRYSDEITGAGKFIKIFPTDISDIDKIKETHKSITRGHRIDCLINNAGITAFKSVRENSLDEISEIINTNLLGSIYAIKTVLNGMIKNGGGTIINIISAAAKKVFIDSSAYSASKAGLLAYSKVLREEVRPHNIRVIDILPGATRTPIWPNDALEKYSNRMMSPDDLAEMIFYLYGSKSNMVPEEVLIKPIHGDL